MVAMLLPASLLVHELAYLIVAGGLAGVHGYLDVAVPASLALAGSAGVALVAAPSLDGPSHRRVTPYSPLILALALTGIFCAQELVEALLLGGGAEGFAASLAVSWMVPPLSLLCGAITAGVVLSLERAGLLLARSRDRRPRARKSPVAAGAAVDPELPSAACAGLAFGFSRRPPPEPV
jgi:hypothetical protein